MALVSCTGQSALNGQTTPAPEPEEGHTYTFEASDEALVNPLTGFAAEADYTELAEKYSLVYFEVLWNEVEPEEGKYDFDALTEKYHLDRWKQEGKHAVLRVICDKPSGEKHMDIPEWLYAKTGDGAFYSYDGKQGYSPDYNNESLIKAHDRLIKALGKYFDQNGFVAYVELGSLGHWGEWHVKYDAGIPRLPNAEVRERYVKPYLTAFSYAEILMRRPFNTAATHALGLYNDMAGHPESTADWLDWIANGGDYHQTLEENALTPMPDAWKSAPIGGEFTSDIPYQTMLGSDLSTTVDLLTRSHTTFLGPQFPSANRPENGQGMETQIDEIIKCMGYRYHVQKVSAVEISDTDTVSIALTLTNLGNAPIYRDFPVCLYLLDEGDNPVSVVETELALSHLLPGQTVTAQVHIRDYAGKKLAIGAKDPMTGQPALSFATAAPRVGTLSVLIDFASMQK